MADKYLRFLVLATAVAALLILGLHFGQKRLAARYVRLSLSQAEYMATLRNSYDFGCSTIEFRRPDLLFVGASIVRAGWDFGLVQRKLPDRTVGACTPGNMTVRTLVLLADQLMRTGAIPETIVLGISPDFFTPLRAFDQAQQKRVLEADWARQYAREFVMRTILTRRLVITDKLLEEAWLRDVAAIEAMDDDRLGEIVVRRQIELTPPLEPLTELAGLVRDFCTFVDRHGIDLRVIDMPYDSLWWQRQAPSMRADYEKAADLFKSCSRDFVVPAGAEFGLGHRHHIYSLPSVAGGTLDYANLVNNPELAVQAFDSRHLSLVGGRRFTRKALELLDLRRTAELGR